jgi:DNA-binding GntR family transcriptional regulator
MASLTQIGSLSLREQAHAAIRAAIVLGEIEPNAVHSVPSLAAQLGVSPTPVREAMLDLASEGLVEPIRNKGFRIVEVTERDLDEIFQLRLMLEVPAVGAVAGALGVDEIEVLTHHLASMEASVAAANLTTFLEADRRFHLTLLTQFGNGRLVQIVDRLREHTRLYGLPRMLRAGQLAKVAREHSLILEAVAVGDRALAERLMTEHLKHTRGIWAGLTVADGGDGAGPDGSQAQDVV